MSHYGIPSVDRSCGSYGPGHQVHWIQAKKSAEEGPVIHVSVVVHDDGRVDLEGHQLKLTMWNHDPGRLQSALDYCGRAVWKPRFHLLAVPGPSGYLFTLAALEEWTSCHPGTRQVPGESTVDFLARAMREDRGFTVPGRSLPARDVLGDQETTNSEGDGP
jgi:hypothetical protein